MSILTMRMLQPYMLETDGEGGDTGGAQPADRGDTLPEAELNQPAEEAKGEAEELTEDEKEALPPRDSTGKFTKKEKEDEAHIPKARFDDAVNKERAAREAAERRAAELEARVKQEEKSVDIQKMEEGIEKLESQHAKLLLDGEHEKAAAVMKQIRHGERQIARMESDEKTSRATAQAVEQVRMEAAIARIESDYPVLNEKSEDYNPKLVNLVLAEQRRLITEEGVGPSRALAQAAADVMELYQPKAAATAKTGLAAAATDRKSAQVAKNLDTAKRQPASMKDAGIDSDKAGEKALPDVSNMTAAEFNALPETTKARLRGDFV